MTRIKWLNSLLLVSMLAAAPVFAQDSNPAPIAHGIHFVDLDGDGINDNAPDHDGDDVPNGLDPDYQGALMNRGARGFVDLDGDGISDNAGGGRGSTGTAFGAGRKGTNPTGVSLRSGRSDGTGSQGIMQRVRGNGRAN